MGSWYFVIYVSGICCAVAISVNTILDKVYSTRNSSDKISQLIRNLSSCSPFRKLFQVSPMKPLRC